MATRPVFVPKDTPPYYASVDIEFDWNGGFATTQKQKNIRALHEGFNRRYLGKRALEISSKSYQDGGEDLSAFFLKKHVPSKNADYTVECVFQSGKVFENGGPYLDLLDKTSREAKKDERLHNSGRLKNFTFEGLEFPLKPETLFYDYLYLNALLENPDKAKVLLDYDGFTDIEFNPERSRNCQAKSCAAYVALKNLGLLDKVRDYESFKELYVTNTLVKEPKPVTPLIKINVNDKIIHQIYGEGMVVNVDDRLVTILFNDEIGEKKLGLDWVIKNTKIN